MHPRSLECQPKSVWISWTPYHCERTRFCCWTTTMCMRTQMGMNLGFLGLVDLWARDCGQCHDFCLWQPKYLCIVRLGAPTTISRNQLATINFRALTIWRTTNYVGMVVKRSPVVHPLSSPICGHGFLWMDSIEYSQRTSSWTLLESLGRFFPEHGSLKEHMLQRFVWRNKTER